MTEYASRGGLDLDELHACLAEDRPAAEVRSDIAQAHAVGVTTTPTSYINGRPVTGALKPWMLEAAIEAITPLPLPTPPSKTERLLHSCSKPASAATSRVAVENARPSRRFTRTRSNTTSRTPRRRS